MGRPLPIEGRAPATADHSKVRNGGITKAPQPSKLHIPLSQEVQERLIKELASHADDFVRKLSKPEVIEIESDSDEVEEVSDAEDELEEVSDAEDEDDGYNSEDEAWRADQYWKDEWEIEDDAVTTVGLPQFTDITPIVTQEVFVVHFSSNFHLINLHYSHHVLGIYNDQIDANMAAQEHALKHSSFGNCARYKERVYADGTFHARAKGAPGQEYFVDVKVEQYNVRDYVAMARRSVALPKPQRKYIVRGEVRDDVRRENEMGNLVDVQILGEFDDLVAANSFAMAEMAAEAGERRLNTDYERFPDGMYEAFAQDEWNGLKVFVKLRDW